MPEPPEIRTHASIDPTLCGEPAALAPGSAEVILTATSAMVADAHGLVHGGFVFSLADHAAMLAVNEPTVVLAKAVSRFLSPVREGERLLARARVAEPDGGGRPGRPVVEVTVEGPAGAPVFTGTFHCAVPERHVLERSGPARGRAPAGEGR